MFLRKSPLTADTTLGHSIDEEVYLVLRVANKVFKKYTFSPRFTDNGVDTPFVWDMSAKKYIFASSCFVNLIF